MLISIAPNLKDGYYNVVGTFNDFESLLIFLKTQLLDENVIFSANSIHNILIFVGIIIISPYWPKVIIDLKNIS